MHIHYAMRVSRSVARHPLQSFERIQGRNDARRDAVRVTALGGSTELYAAVSEPMRRMHELLAIPWPCREAREFGPLWDEILAELQDAGVRVGLASYRGWNDGDRSLAAAIWCAVRHMRPGIVVETGVAHGLTSRVVLEGLDRNGIGRLHSIDLPAVDPALHAQVGIAVPRQLADSWSYVEGTSRERMPALVRSLPTVDLFVHDSLHTARNTRFELETIWPRMSAGGVAFVDDIHRNAAFREFVNAARPRASFAASHALGPGMWGALLK